MTQKQLPEDWDWLDQLVGPLDDDFVEAASEKCAEQMRTALDDVFK